MPLQRKGKKMHTFFILTLRNKDVKPGSPGHLSTNLIKWQYTKESIDQKEDWKEETVPTGPT